MHEVTTYQRYKLLEPVMGRNTHVDKLLKAKCGLGLKNSWGPSLKGNSHILMRLICRNLMMFLQ